MAGRLEGKAAIVTGGARGIGGGTVLRLAEEGCKVLIADVDEAMANERAGIVRQNGGTAEVLRADVSKEEDIRAMVDEAVRRFGRLDVVVNNAYAPASGGGGGTAEKVSSEGWDAAMAILLKSMYLSTKYAVPELRKGGGGAIVNISSVHGLLQAPGGDDWSLFACLNSLRDVEPTVNLVLDDGGLDGTATHPWTFAEHPPVADVADDQEDAHAAL